MSNVKDNSFRGDFYSRDVYRRHSYASFANASSSESSTFYINENNAPIPCTSQVSTFSEGEGALHIYARNGIDFNKGNVAQAAVSICAATTTIRSINTRVGELYGRCEAPCGRPGRYD